MNNKNKIPTNMNNEEEAIFWDTHDLLDFIGDTKEVEITISQNIKNTLRSRYKERIKEMTFNKYMSNLTTTTCMASRKTYLYMQTKSNVTDNPDAINDKKENNKYPRYIAHSI